MKVGIFLNNISPESGGGFTFEDNIVNALINTKCTEDQFYFLHSSNHQIKSDNENINFVNLNNYKYYYQNKTFKKLIDRAFNAKVYEENKCKIFLNDLIKKHKLDIIWFVSPTGPAELYNIKIPYMVTVWDLQHRLQPYFPEVNYSGWVWEEREKFYSTVLPKASYIITGNEEAKSQICSFYSVSPKRVYPIPLATPDFALNAKDKASEILKKHDLKSGRYLFYPAQFWPHKNHIRLLKALKTLNEKHNADLTIVFTGSDKGNMAYIKKKTKELELTDRVKFLGFVEKTDLLHLYKNAFALVFPSYFGPDNIPPLEAMALGCPVICSNADGMTEQLGENALFFDPGNDNQIVEQVLKLQNDLNLRQNLIDSGYERARSFTTEDYVNKIFAILDEFRPIAECWNAGKSFIHL